MSAAIRDWLRRLRATFHRAPEDAEMEEELRLHVDMIADELKRRGLSFEDAARQARLQAGGIAHVMEQRRDQRGLRWLEDFIQDQITGLLSKRDWAILATEHPVRQQATAEANAAAMARLKKDLTALGATFQPARGKYGDAPAGIVEEDALSLGKKCVHQWGLPGGASRSSSRSGTVARASAARPLTADVSCSSDISAIWRSNSS